MHFNIRKYLFVQYSLKFQYHNYAFSYIADHSYYSYAGWNGKSFDQFSNIRLINGENIERVRRATPDKSVVAPEQKEDSVKDQSSTQPHPQQQQPQQQPQPPQQSQQQPQLQQPQQQQQVTPTQPAPSNTTNTSASVTYSTAYSTSEVPPVSITVRPSDPVPSPKLDLKKKTSQTAANPATDAVGNIEEFIELLLRPDSHMKRNPSGDYSII